MPEAETAEQIELPLRGAPNLHVRDQLGWHEFVELGRPGWRFTAVLRRT